MKYVATLNGKKYEIEIERVDGYRPLDRGVQAAAPAPIVAQAAAPAPAPAPAPVPAAAPAGGTSVDAPMPGKILGVKVKVGDAVSAGQTVVVMEARKMETEIVAPVAGTVTAVMVNGGDMVESGAPMVSIG